MTPEDKAREDKSQERAQEHNSNNPIHPGTIIQNLQCPEPVEIKLSKEAGEYVHIVEAAAYARSIDEIIAEIHLEVDEDYIARMKENLGESLVTRFIDYTRIKEMVQQAREHRLIPEYTESFFQKAFLRAGGSAQGSPGWVPVDRVESLTTFGRWPMTTSSRSPMGS